MGDILLKYYKYATEQGGLKAKIELAKLTHIPVTRAAFTEDTPRNIEQFRKAIKKITNTEPPF